MAIGLVIMFFSAFLGYLSGTSLDGVIGIHYVKNLTLSQSLYLGFSGWFILAVCLWFSGLIYSPSKIRAIYVFGTQALARTPFLIAPIIGFSDVFVKAGEYFIASFVQQGEVISLTTADWNLFILFALVIVLIVVYSVALMYNAYSVSVNLKGSKAVVSFIISLLVALIISNFLNVYFLPVV